MRRLRSSFCFHVMLALLLCLSTAVTARPCSDSHTPTAATIEHSPDHTTAAVDDSPCHAIMAQEDAGNAADTEQTTDCCDDGNCAKCCIAPFGLTGTNDTLFSTASHPPYHGYTTIAHDYRADRPEHPPKSILRVQLIFSRT